MTIKYESTSFIVLEFTLIEQMAYWQEKYHEVCLELQVLLQQEKEDNDR